jgi:type I restriction enzyme, S subunit
MSAEVRAGYKLTDVGVIPAEWAFGELADLNPFVTSGSRGWAEHYSDRGDTFLRITNMSRDSIYIDTSNLKLVNLPSDDNEGKRTQLQNDDLLVSITADIGIIGYIDDAVPKPAYINQHIALVRFDPDKADSKFLSYYLAGGNSQALFRAATDKGAKAGMSLSGVCKINAAFPPLPEQRAIAAALSDVDALLAKQGQLIAKKQGLKQAAMQQLLTGQTRLPGFSGDWSVLPLQKVCWFQEGPGVRTHQFKTAGVKLLNGTNIAKGKVLLETTNRYISQIEADGAYNHFLVDEGDILLATSGITIDRLDEKVAIAKREDLPLCMNTSTVRFKVSNAKLTASYLYVFLRSNEFKNQIGQQATGSAQINFGPSHLEKIEISVPPTLIEQTAIAAILSDMDTEIAAFEARQTKTRALKQGMMQELLTGRTRLV